MEDVLFVLSGMWMLVLAEGSLKTLTYWSCNRLDIVSASDCSLPSLFDIVNGMAGTRVFEKVG